jgi:hypothetical protein
MTFAMLNQKFKTNTFVVYCDKKDTKTYNEILKAMVKARKELPINLKPNPDSGMIEKKQRHADVVFVLSSIKTLMPIAKLHSDSP